MLRTFTDIWRIRLAIGLLGCWALTSSAQDEVRLFQPLVTGLATPGYYLLAPTNNEKLGLVDHGGWVVHRTPVRSALNLQRHPDGTYTYFTPGAGHVRMDSTFTVAIDTIQASDGGTDFHEVKILANGNYLVLGGSRRSVDMSKLVQGGVDTAKVLDAVIEEIEPDGDIVWRWNSKDHTSILDVTRGIDLTASTLDYIHVNSLHVDSDNNILISMRNFDEIGKIDRATGAFKWRLGGSESKNNQFTWLNDTVNGFRGFSHQHSIVRTAPNRIMIMDNGTLKPTEYSRAVEYELNETLKTIRRVWEYRHTPDVFVRVMGSVERLPNGGTLIGWGQNLDRMVLTELDSAGNVVFEMKNATGVNVASYRVGTYPLRMIADKRRVSAPGSYVLRSTDSSTGLTMHVHRVGAPRTVVAERHRMAPMGRTYQGAVPIDVDPVRWTIRHDISSSDSVRLTVALNAVHAVRDPRHALIWHRGRDGEGDLTLLSGAFDPAARSWTFDHALAGEYMVGYLIGTTPVPLSPDSGASNVDVEAPLQWSRSIAADSFTVELDTLPSFIGSPRSFTSMDTSWNPAVLRGAQEYWWRVRAWSNNVAGPWSSVMSFRTTLRRPLILRPLAGQLLVPERFDVAWRSVEHAQSYRVRVALSDRQIIRRTADTSVSVEGIPGDSVLQLDVTAEGASDTSLPMMPVVVRTLPHRPLTIGPSPGTVDVDVDQAVLQWKRISGQGVQVRCTGLDTSVLVVDQTTELDTFLLTNLDRGRLYRWSVRALGRQGASAWTPSRWFATAGPSVHTAAVLIAPTNGQVIERADVTLEWRRTDASTRSLVHVSSDTAFTDPLVDTVIDGVSALRLTDLPTDRQLYWRVYETTDGSTGEWSSAWRFIITGTGLGPIFPAHGAMNVPTLGEVVYTTSARFSEYRVEFFVEGNDTVPDHLFASITDRCRYLGLYPSTWYTWRTVGLRSGGESEVGPTSKFRTSPTLHVEQMWKTSKVTYIHGAIEVTGEVTSMDRCVLMDAIGRSISCPPQTISDGRILFEVPPEASSSVYTAVISRGTKRIASSPLMIMR